MKIPVFVSRPNKLNPSQEASCQLIYSELDRLSLEPRTLGQGEYPVDGPLREVLVLSRHCAGGVILGFSQVIIKSAVSKPGTPDERVVRAASLPTPWNQLEAGILTARGVPLLIFSEPGVSGGIFDRGVGEFFIHDMPVPTNASATAGVLQDVMMKWQARVRDFYYQP